MARMSPIWRAGAVLVALAWLPSGGCSSSGDAQPLAGGGGVLSRGGSQGEPTVVMPDPDGNGGAESAALNPLCGTGRCVPDAALACFGYEPAAGGAGQAGGEGEAGDSAGDSSAGGGGGASGTDAGGAAGEVTLEAGAPGSGGATGGDGGAAIAAGGAPAAGEAGSGAGAGGEAPAVPLPYACHVTLAGAEPERACLSAGLGSASDPCFSAADCRPGLACVSEGEGGRCLPYCCTGDSSCKLGTYCAERKLRVADDRSNIPAPRVPVCVPADACSLEEVYPCPEGADCRCKGGTACMVVRADGTTTCLEPGAGKQGEACPCAWNHVCSSATQTCVKICHTDSTSNECGKQRCQASSELPQEFGVCVGPT